MPQLRLKDLGVKTRYPLRVCVIVVASLWLSVSLSITAFAGGAGAKATGTIPQASFTLDGVTLTIKSSFMPARFVVASADNMTQMASAVAQHPYREFQIEAIPFNTIASLERLPAARAGGAQAYRAVLHAFRAANGAQTVAHPVITLFGQRVTGEANIVQLHLDSLQLKDALLTEYVVEAGSRLWLIRLTQELQSLPHHALTTSAQSTLGSLTNVAISSSAVNQPSAHIATLLREQQAQFSHGSIKHMGAFYSPLTGGTLNTVKQSHLARQLSGLFHTPRSATQNANLPFPGWWSGVCDYNNYWNATGWQSWQMNSGLNGVYPCGPRPLYGGPDNAVQFYAGSWGEYEWECVELSMRWMYLAYGVSPYPANGNQVVSNYSTSDGGNMAYYQNNTNCCVVPEPGDVLSYCSTCTAGHTSVVMSTSVNSSGNGSITIMEENAVHNGMETLTVSNWEVTNTSAGWVYGYLHHL